MSVLAFDDLMIITFQIIVTCACEETNPEVSKEYDVLRRMIDSEDNFLEVKALGEDLAMQVLKLVPTQKIWINKTN